ncbi:restriction endonuclease subunit S [uncultured Phascolarctobacterium sp.]|uniref:restriction endonuclease subunit S n=1 Tax=uncultured Phascolarctobacterium sp. TaxID=512296 RepID=UPI0025F1A494|nr:restriction endonuclease subunit S [uncultured Phascolarctobacterium sp.]
MPKKKTALTIEERLQQALVPAEEQPYEVPENWVWVYGKNIFMPMESRKPDGEDFYYIDIDAIDNKNQVVTEAKKIKTAQAPSRASRKLHTGDTVFSLVRPYLKNIAYIDVQLSDCIASTGFFVCTPNAALNDKYLYRLMVSSYVVDGLNKHMKGDNSPSIRKDDIENYPFPLPPLSEQQRIVERIEELFAKLDEAKERLQEAADSFTVRKAAILHKAFTGELTQQWRRENGVSDESWEEKTIGEICSSLKYGTSKKSSDDGEVVVLRMGNLQNGEIDWSNLAYTSDEEDIKKYLLKSGDVLFNRTNSPELVGKTSIYRGEMPAIYAGYLIKLDYEKNIVVGDYLNYYLNSSKAKEYYMQVKTDGVSQSNINAKKIGEFEIPLPTLSEQHEIVRLINDLLARERKAQQAAEQALASIDLMKKSILACAFRGELGTNKANKASAQELLQPVLAEN